MSLVASPSTEQQPADGDLELAKRNTAVLTASQAVVGAVAPICISTGGLAGWYLLDLDKSLATAPVAGYNVGVALGAVPAAMLARAIGRRYALMSGAGVTALGGVVAAFALLAHEFWLFVAGLLIAGFAGAFSQQYRFAATDHAPAAFRPKAISWVLAGGLAAAIVASAISIATRDALDPVPFAGTFVAVVALGLGGAAILSHLRTVGSVSTAGEPGGEARSLGEIVRQPQYLAALTCSVGAYALMAFVMTGAPLAMVECGHSMNEATLGIQWHVMAMFGPSFVTGHLIVRYGRDRVIAIGFGLLVACALVALLGLSLAHFWIALVLLGVGWNFAFIGATAMVTETYRPSERGRAQGFHDLVLFSSVATASLLSGSTLNAFGWDMLNWIVFPVSVVCLAVLIGHARRARILRQPS